MGLWQRHKSILDDPNMCLGTKTGSFSFKGDLWPESADIARELVSIAEWQAPPQTY